jgi:uncharacterized protein (TIGR02284 family)
MKKIVRSDAEVALDEVTECCKFVADHYRSAARVAHDPDLVRLFQDLEQKRQQWVEALEAQVRRMGNLPSAPDADREAIEHLLIRLRAVVSEERASLLRESDRVEKALIEKARGALEGDFPADARPLVQKIFTESEQIRERLRLLNA